MSASKIIDINTAVAHTLHMEAIQRYAEADKSDPFCYARCMTHYRQGVTNRKQVEGQDPVEAQYDAQRDTNGGWRNRVRP